jgi:hypothetical protein
MTKAETQACRTSAGFRVEGHTRILDMLCTCRVTLYGSERERYPNTGVSLDRSHFSKRKYEHLSYVVNVLVPVRYPLKSLGREIMMC